LTCPRKRVRMQMCEPVVENTAKTIVASWVFGGILLC